MTSVIHQDSSHQLRRHAKKMRSILPVNPALVDKPQVSLVDEGGRLKSMLTSLLAHVARGDSMQLVVNSGEQSRLSFSVTRAETEQEICDLFFAVDSQLRNCK